MMPYKRRDSRHVLSLWNVFAPITSTSTLKRKSLPATDSNLVQPLLSKPTLMLRCYLSSKRPMKKDKRQKYGYILPHPIEQRTTNLVQQKKKKPQPNPPEDSSCWSGHRLSGKWTLFAPGMGT